MKTVFIAALVLTLVVYIAAAESTPECSYALKGKIKDDPTLDSLILNARRQFLASRPHPFKRCDITLLVKNIDGTYTRGSYNQEELAYPASTVKLTFLVSALEWCKKQGLNYDCLDEHLRPMIYVSDNFETGVIVDFITQSVNYHPTNQSVSDPTFVKWYNARKFASDYLASRGLLEDQNILSKTYPSNSGPGPTGAEDILKSVYGHNLMKPKCAASLMAEISSGLIHPEATQYMLQMLRHARYSVTTVGMGTPPGTVMHNKVGYAYDTLEDIAHLILPGGTELILAVYTNGYEPSEPAADNLSYLAQLIITSLPQKYNPTTYDIATVDTSDIQTFGQGWHLTSELPDHFGAQYWYAASPPAHSLPRQYAIFDIGKKIAEKPVGPSPASPVAGEPVESDHLYEVSVFTPESSKFGIVTYTVNHVNGVTAVNVDQRVNGGRFFKLGDFNLDAESFVNLTTTGTAPFVANAVQAFPWPTCGKYVGTTCTSWL